jgi:transcriptional regulator with XRE-family HTH domain
MLSGATLRDLRRQTGRTQVDVALQVGIPASVLSAYECGRRQPSLEVAGRIIDALGFRVHFVPRLNDAVQAQKLEDVLTLAEALPYRPQPLAKAQPGAGR